MHNWQAIFGSIAGTATAFGGVFAWMKSRREGNAPMLKRVFGIEPAAEDLRMGLDNLSAVVQSQGQSIDLLTAELNVYREELATAREQLRTMDGILEENATLKYKVEELETQVKALEEELARRKKYTPKAHRTETPEAEEETK